MTDSNLFSGDSHVELTLGQIRELIGRVRQEIAKVIIGQQEVIDHCLVVILTGSHGLIEGVPGIAKTLLVRTLARVLGVDFNRIQFTPDLMPADITGTTVFNMQQQTFTLLRGPVFATFLLADEINRAPAKTQSALLQAMQERVVTIDGATHPLSPQFTVFATQNPIEYEGTYPLPEAQKDRFMLKIPMTYPAAADELTLAGRTLGSHAPEVVLEGDTVQPVVSTGILGSLQQGIRQVIVREELTRYVVDIVRHTRVHESVLVGAGPRATQALLLAARARAFLEGRDFVTPDDVKALAVAALEHRIVLRPEFEIEGMSAAEAIDSILTEVEVPR